MAEAAVAIFSCSIPSLTHLFRRIISLAGTGRAKDSSDNSKNTKHGYAVSIRRMPKLGRNGDFERLEAEGSFSDNAGLVGPQLNASTISADSLNPAHEPIDLQSINVRRDFEVAFNRNSPV